MLLDHLNELRQVGHGLLFTDATDLQCGFDALRFEAGEKLESLIAEDDIHRHALRLGDGVAVAFEFLKEDIIKAQFVGGYFSGRELGARLGGLG